MRYLFFLAVVLSVACGGEPTTTTPTAPTPTPTSAPTPLPAITISGTITDTVTGAEVGSFTHSATSLPARVTVSAPGYVSRETWVQGANPRVDLFPERGFDLAFYRQLIRDDFDRLQGQLQPVRVLTQAPMFYMEVEGGKGLSVQVATKVEAVARRIVPAMTGGRFHVTRWETGPTQRQPQPGWITITRDDDLAGPEWSLICARATVGESAGLIRINGDSRCQTYIEFAFAHDLGHALGFFHVNRPGTLMYRNPLERGASTPDAPTEIERHHAALAYSRPRGNTDIDVDPQMPAAVREVRIIVD